MIEILHKAGDTLVWECEHSDDAGEPVDLLGYSIKCQARSKKKALLFEASTTNGKIDIYDSDNGYFRIKVDETSEFKPEEYMVDIQYSYSDIVKSSETFKLIVEEDITR